MESRQSKWLKTPRGKAYQKKYNDANKEKKALKNRLYRAKQKAEDPDYYKNIYIKYNLLEHQRKYRARQAKES